MGVSPVFSVLPIDGRDARTTATRPLAATPAYQHVYPPSTTRLLPVKKHLASDARKTTAGYGLTKNGEKNPDAWKFLASLVRGEGLQQALNDLNDLPAISGFEPQGEVTANIKEMYNRFMADLPRAENQRFLSPQVSEELDSVLGGVAAGTVTPEDGLKRVQAATDKALGKK